MGRDLDEHFEAFTKALRLKTKAFDRLSKEEKDRVRGEQVNLLSKLELVWRKELVNSQYCREVYENFITHVCDVLGNVRSARPFFRERQKGFPKRVSAPLMRRAWRPLLQLHPNFHFIKLAMGARRWPKKSKLYKLYTEIDQLRKELITNNLPLVISRTDIFTGRIAPAHLTFMDFVSLGAEGLIAGIDKFSGPYCDTWASVAIGRIHGNYIESTSETSMHFYPDHRRALYRAHKALSGRPVKGIPRTLKSIEPSHDEVLRQVNTPSKPKPGGKVVKPPRAIKSDELEQLLAAASTVSADTVPGSQGDDAGASILDREAAPETSRPDVQAEEREVRSRVSDSYAKLPLKYRKFLALRGVQVHV